MSKQISHSSETVHAYLYHDPYTKIPFYAGIGVKNRWKDHLKGSTNLAVAAKIVKLRDEGLIPLICVWNLDDWELACLVEQELISKYGRKQNSSGSLYNLTDGGEGRFGSFPTSETKTKMSIAKLGKLKSSETRKRMSKPKSPETILKMKALQQSLKVNSGRIWINNGISRNMIPKSCSIPEGWIRGKTFKTGELNEQKN